MKGEFVVGKIEFWKEFGEVSSFFGKNFRTTFIFVVSVYFFEGFWREEGFDRLFCFSLFVKEKIRARKFFIFFSFSKCFRRNRMGRFGLEM